MSVKRVSLLFRHRISGEVKTAHYEATYVPAKIWQSELPHHQKEIDDLVRGNSEQRDKLISEMSNQGYELIKPLS